MLMHNGQLADPLNEFTKKMKEISGKKKKTDADFEQLAKLEFMGSLWLNEDGRPVIPSHVIEAVGVAGAKKVRDGQTAKAAFFAQDAILVYAGPSEKELLWADHKYRHVAGVRVTTSRVIRTRPKFSNWSIEVLLDFEDEIANESQIRGWFIKAGQMVGIGDWRPKFGRFVVQ